MNIRPAILGQPAIVLLALAAGCGSLKTPYPAKELFAITVPTSMSGVSGAPGQPAGTLRVEGVRIAPPFDQRVLAYRVGGERFEFDYYREFVADPSALLTGETVRYLAGSGRFGTVLDPGSTAQASFWLETSVEAFYGDFRDAANPTAVVRARFFLISVTQGASTIVGDWTAESTVPLASPAPEALPAALGRAYGDVLARFVEASRGVEMR